MSENPADPDDPGWATPAAKRVLAASALVMLSAFILGMIVAVIRS